MNQRNYGKEILTDLRFALLGLHKVLVEFERFDYERAHGKVTSYQLLQLLIQDPQFAWLHVVSELIVRIDEMFDTKEPATKAEIDSIFDEARKLLQPMEISEAFGTRYQEALQRNPDAVMAHTKVRESLKAREET